MQKSHSELVEFAKSRLIDLSNLVDRFDVPVVEQRTADLLACLDELCEQYECDARLYSGQGRSLASVDIAEAWRLGMAPDGADIGPNHAYLEKLDELGRRCSTCHRSCNSPQKWALKIP